MLGRLDFAVCEILYTTVKFRILANSKGKDVSISNILRP